MKKLLGIVVLGLLWCNIGYAGDKELKTKSDLTNLLIKSGLTLSFEESINNITFYNNGTGNWDDFPIIWEAITNNTFKAANPNYVDKMGYSTIKLNFNNSSATATNSDNSKINYFILSPNLE